MVKKLKIFVILLSTGIFIMKLNINATSECSTTGGGTTTTPVSLHWVKINYYSNAFSSTIYSGGELFCLMNLARDPYNNFTHILPYNATNCTLCSGANAGGRYGYMQFLITATGYTANNTIKIDYNTGISTLSSTTTGSTNISGQHIQILSNGEIQIAVPLSVGYIFRGIVKSPCGANCDNMSTNNVYVYTNDKNGSNGVTITNPSAPSIDLNLDSRISTYSKAYFDCTPDY